MQILTLTINPAIDTSVAVDQVAPEIKLRCSQPHRDAGGGGLNVSRVIRRLGGESLAIYPVGGPTGTMLQSLLDVEGLTCQTVQTEGWTRENLVVLDRGTQQQYRFGMPGPQMSEVEWQACLDEVIKAGDTAQYIVASGSLPPGVPEDFYARVARIAAERDIRLILDTSGPPLQHGIEVGAYLIKPNMRELGNIAGVKIESETQQEAIAIELVDSGRCEIVVVSLGAAGAFVATREARFRVRAPVVPIRSAVGAGDSMVAGIVTSLAKGMSVEQSIRYGVAAGSAAVMTPGTDLCHRDDVDMLYQEMTNKVG